MLDIAKIADIARRHGGKREHVIAMLMDCQEELGYLPRESLETLAGEIGAPVTSVLSIATFYRTFSLKPVGRHQVHVCMGTACNIQGGPRLVEALERELKIRKGETTPDMQFSLDTVNCVGCCGLAPVITVGPDVHGKVRQSALPRILKKYKSREISHAEAVH